MIGFAPKAISILFKPTLLVILTLYAINKSAKIAASKIDAHFKSFLANQSNIEMITDLERLSFAENEYLNRWISEVDSLGLIFVCDQIERHKNINAIHSVWWEPRNKFFAYCIANNVNDRLNSKFCISLLASGKILSLYAGKGMMMSMPGIYRREYCDKNIETRKMFSKYTDLLNSDEASAITNGDVRNYLSIREKLKSIRIKFQSETHGVIPFEVLRHLNNSINPLMRRLVHYHVLKLNKTKVA